MAGVQAPLAQSIVTVLLGGRDPDALQGLCPQPFRVTVSCKWLCSLSLPPSLPHSNSGKGVYACQRLTLL